MIDEAAKINKESYLKDELYALIKKDDSIFNFIQDSTLDGLWYWDLTNPENEWMNNEFWEILGYDPSKMPHKSSAWQDIIFKEDLDLALVNFNKHLENPDHPYDQIVRYRHKNGNIIWVRCRGMAIRDENGKPIRMIGAHNDITSQKLAEADLIEANKTKDKLFSIIAHDLRGPIGSITGISELLIEGWNELPEENKLSLTSTIHQSLVNTYSLLDDLLSWSREQINKSSLAPGNLQLRDVITKSIANVKNIADLKNIKINNTIDNSISVFADENSLNVIARNIISNAIKFSFRDGTIDISGKINEFNSSSFAEISITDYGVGMTSHQLESLFKSETNTSTKGTEHEPGTGLGLILCKEFIERNGGTINLRSQKNKGTVVSFTLPIA